VDAPDETKNFARENSLRALAALVKMFMNIRMKTFLNIRRSRGIKPETNLLRFRNGYSPAVGNCLSDFGVGWTPPIHIQNGAEGFQEAIAFGAVQCAGYFLLG
jgi:hypothetical protein